MEQVEKSTGKNWLFFFLSLALMSAMLWSTDYRQWFWLVLPIVCTQFAKAMDIM